MLKKRNVLKRKIPGINNPNSPRSSLIPIKRIRLTGDEATHGSDTANSSMGWVAFITPAIINIIANNPWAIHNPIFNALLFFCWVILISVLVFSKCHRF